jgi:hypothetical protein
MKKIVDIQVIKTRVKKSQVPSLVKQVQLHETFNKLILPMCKQNDKTKCEPGNFTLTV